MEESVRDVGSLSHMRIIIGSTQARKDVKKNYYAVSHFYDKCLEAYLHAAYVDLAKHSDLTGMFKVNY